MVRMRYFPRNKGGWPLQAKHVFVTPATRRKYQQGCDLANRIISRLVGQLPEFGTAEEFQPWVRNVEAAIDLMQNKAFPAIHRAYDEANKAAKAEYYEGTR